MMTWYLDKMAENQIHEFSNFTKCIINLHNKSFVIKERSIRAICFATQLLQKLCKETYTM